MTIWRCKGIHVDFGAMRILRKRVDKYGWETLAVTDKDSGKQVKRYFNGSLVQTSSEEVYLADQSSFIQINIRTGIFQKLQNMHYPRLDCGICLLGTKIYVAGGRDK